MFKIFNMSKLIWNGKKERKNPDVCIEKILMRTHKNDWVEIRHMFVDFGSIDWTLDYNHI